MKSVALFAIPAILTMASAVPPENIAVNRHWSTNEFGYIYSVGYFTPDEESSPAWEAKRLEAGEMVQVCETKSGIRRDVRWFAPIAPGQPQCALIVYSVACSSPKSPGGAAFEYEREQALLEEPEQPIGLNCGEKDRAKVPMEHAPAPSGALLTKWDADDCAKLPDKIEGQFHLRPVTYIRARTMLSAGYVRKQYEPYPVDPAGFLAHAASEDRKIHVVAVKRDIPQDADNIFVDQSFAVDGDGYCLTLSARQGRSIWRKSIRRPTVPARQSGMMDKDNHSKQPELYWTQYSDSHLLQHRLAEHLGIPIPPGHTPLPDQ